MSTFCGKLLTLFLSGNVERQASSHVLDIPPNFVAFQKYLKQNFIDAYNVYWFPVGLPAPDQLTKSSPPGIKFAVEVFLRLIWRKIKTLLISKGDDLGAWKVNFCLLLLSYGTIFIIKNRNAAYLCGTNI